MLMVDLAGYKPEALHFGSDGPTIRWAGTDGKQCTTDFQRFYPTTIGVGHASGTLRVDWEDTCGLPVSDFFYPTLFKKALLHPGCGRDLQTTWRDFVDVTASCHPAALRGMVFHSARCGSTLVHRMLNELDSAFSLCEPGTVGSLLGVMQGWTDVASKEALDLLLRVLGRPTTQDKDKFFIKFSDVISVSICEVRKLLPAIPTLFIYRDPHEILVSILRQPTGMVVEWKENRKMVADRFGLPELADPGMLADEAAACFLGHIFKAVVASAANPVPCAPLKVIDYKSLPDCFATTIAPHFGLDPSKDDLARVAMMARKHSKFAGSRDFEPDNDEKRRAVTSRIVELVERFVAPYSEQCRQLCEA